MMPHLDLERGRAAPERQRDVRPLRIVHAVTNAAGVPTTLMRAQRALGHHAVAVLHGGSRGPAPGAMDLDRLLAGSALSRKLRRGQLLAHLAARYDVFHFHYLGTFLRGYADLALLKALGKTVIFHLHGCDVRDPRRVRAEHAVSACAECSAHCLTSAKLGLPRALRRHVDAVIVATPDLLQFVPDALYIPNPLDRSAWLAGVPERHAPRADRAEWIVAHAPTDRAIKGTRHVEAAVAALRAEGLPVRLRLLEGLSRAELRAACLDADLAVDQVLVGWFGLFALEMLALGVPVVAYVRPDLDWAARDVPIARADPARLAAVLRDLLRSPARRDDLATRGPAYVRAHHDPLAIGRRVLAVYAQHGAIQ